MSTANAWCEFTPCRNISRPLARSIAIRPDSGTELASCGRGVVPRTRVTLPVLIRPPPRIYYHQGLGWLAVQLRLTGQHTPGLSGMLWIVALSGTGREGRIRRRKGLSSALAGPASTR